MKRTTLMRRTPLQSRRQDKKRAPLTRGTRINPVSKTRRVRLGLFTPLLHHVLARTSMAPVGSCEFAAGRTHRGPLDVHHVIKRSQGGTDEPSNLVRLCRGHHDATDLPFAKGRLVITRRLAERFRFEEVFSPTKWEFRL